MTTREFLNAVIAANVSDDITTYATDAVNALDARNEKRKETRANSAKVKENEALKLDALKRIPSDGIMSSALAEQMGLTTAKAAAILRLLKQDGKVTTEEIKVKGRKVMNYRLA